MLYKPERCISAKTISDQFLLIYITIQCDSINMQLNDDVKEGLSIICILLTLLFNLKKNMKRIFSKALANSYFF